MKKNFEISSQQLHSAICDTIRVYDEYQLDKKTYANNTYKILVPSKRVFLQFQIFKADTGCTLDMKAGAIVGKMTEQNAVAWANKFYGELDKIISKQIIITPEVANKDIYKSGQALTGYVGIIRLLIAVIAIAIAIGVLMRL